MITVIEGGIGCGKSLILAKMAKEEISGGKKVYAKAGFSFEGWEEFSLEEKLLEELRDCSIYLDEAYAFFDSRSSQTKTNRLMVQLAAQAVRRGVDLYLSTQDFSYIDKRLRRAAGVRIYCNPIEGGKGKVLVTSLVTGEEETIEVDFSKLYSLMGDHLDLDISVPEGNLDFIKTVLKS